MRLQVNAEDCVGCRICENFCSFHHEGAIWPERSRITIVAESDEGPFIPNVCRQCGALSLAPSFVEGLPKGDDAPCAAACPAEAIALNELTGVWVVDVEECIGCGACVEACPYEAIFLDEELGVPLKCDLCGGEPECAAMCPSGALRYERERE